MAPISSAERDCLILDIKQSLAPTLYACSSLEGIGAGTTSFVFLGTPAQPQHSDDGDSESTFIVKYAAGFISCNQDFPLDASRCKYEALMLSALRNFRPPFTPTSQVIINTPHLHHFEEAANVEVIEYFPNAITLKEALPSLSPSQAGSVGHALGSWLRSFHSWSSTPENVELKNKVGENEKMKALKWKITYEQGSDVLKRFPETIGNDEQTIWEEIKASERGEMDGDKCNGAGNEWGIIHGDFWSGNVLISDFPFSGPLRLHVIDFEFAQVSHRSTDLDQFIGDLLERQHFNPSFATSIPVLIDHFLQGYGPIDDDLAFRTAVYAGVHEINWWSRGPNLTRSEEGKELVKKAWNMVERAWRRDAAWLNDNESGLGEYQTNTSHFWRRSLQ
ncbi:hypothetical protein P280DRAFT_547580 [Massarina eburnea CBS 473.64]|uniref:Aminoglycoside phosphotransferase domain-containing protein n=1 Tax=Massarina eburnea CBS 473.64 TaxID=1395130 RepID=A0A6A6S6D0_9PLEO|nr:hypothetical protein P280DRAFT_547580 [Massarina eburnea CBS 473.64]